MWVTGSTAGPRSTGSMWPISSRWRPKRASREPGTTRFANEGVPVAEVIGRRLNVPVLAKSGEEAPKHFS